MRKYGSWVEMGPKSITGMFEASKVSMAIPAVEVGRDTKLEIFLAKNKHTYLKEMEIIERCELIHLRDARRCQNLSFKVNFSRQMGIYVHIFFIDIY